MEEKKNVLGFELFGASTEREEKLRSRKHLSHRKNMS